MKPVTQKPVILGSGHCCLCATEKGSFCYHISDSVQYCSNHKASAHA